MASALAATAASGVIMPSSTRALVLTLEASMVPSGVISTTPMFSSLVPVEVSRVSFTVAFSLVAATMSSRVEWE